MRKFIIFIIVALASNSIFAGGGYEPEGGWDPVTDGAKDAAIKANEDKALAVEMKKIAERTLKSATKNEVCVYYGKALRGYLKNQFLQFPNSESVVLAEAKRRNIKLDIASVKKGTIKIGMSECSMLAAWGEPESSNRSVGRWGVHTQHVYHSTYIYTENGIITSWQD